MAMRFRHVAPAGAPIGVRDLTAWVRALAATDDSIATLQRKVADRLGVRHCHSTCTGRAAMTVLLRSMRQLGGGRDEVIVPAYTCYSVAASVVRAGLKPRIVDISPETLDYDHERLQSAKVDRVLAVVGTNLYGLPNDMPRLSAFTKSRGLFLIDDAAQALGGSVGGQWCGTWGDAGIYSFDKGKNVSAMDGGLIVTSSDALNEAISAEIRQLPPAGASTIVPAVLKVGAYATMLRPSLYWIVNRIPGLGLGLTRYDTSFAVQMYNAPLAALAATMLDRLDEFTRARRANAAWLRAKLEVVQGINLIQPVAGSEPVYLRFPMLVEEPTLRGQVIRTLEAEGIGATGSYPNSIAAIHQLASFASQVGHPAGKSVAERIVTLPTHPLMTAADLERTVAAIGRVMEPGVIRHPLPAVAN